MPSVTHFLGDLTAWLISVGQQWTALLTGGAIAVLILIWERARKDAINWRVFRWILVGTVVVAAFFSWRQLRSEATLNIVVDGTVIFTAAADAKGQLIPTFTFAVIPVAITNMGPPTVCHNWGAFVTVNGNQVGADAPIIPKDGYSYSMPTGERLTVLPSGVIENLTGSDPIPTGGRRIGYHLARFHMSQTDILPYENSLRVGCVDADNNLHFTIGDIPTNTNGQFQIIQGLDK